MGEKKMRIVQLNCQNAYSVMCDLGNVMCEKKVDVLLLHEPYVSNDRVCGLPNGARVYMKAGGGKAAVVVNGENKCDLCTRMYRGTWCMCMVKYGNMRDVCVLCVLSVRYAC